MSNLSGMSLSFLPLLYLYLSNLECTVYYWWQKTRMQSSLSHSPASTSILSQSWRLRIHPNRPFNDVPFLLSCSPSTSLLSLRKRIANVLRKYTEVKDEHVLLFISSDGIDFALVEDGPISDLLQNGEKIA